MKVNMPLNKEIKQNQTQFSETPYTSHRTDNSKNFGKKLSIKQSKIINKTIKNYL